MQNTTDQLFTKTKYYCTMDEINRSVTFTLSNVLPRKKGLCYAMLQLLRYQFPYSHHTKNLSRQISAEKPQKNQLILHHLPAYANYANLKTVVCPGFPPFQV